MRKIINTKSLPKMHLLCANDEYRTALNHVFCTKQSVVAANAHVLVAHQTCDLFDEDFISKMPETIYIKSIIWRELCSKPNYRIEYLTELNAIKIYYANYAAIFPILVDDQNGLFQYPKWELVIPNKKDKQGISEIGVNPYTLSLLKNTLFLDSSEYTIRLTFFDKNKAILVNSTQTKSYGIIMPVSLSDYL